MLRKALVVISWRKDTEWKVLMLRLIPKRGAFWQPVTGHCDGDERFEEAALRESREETGLDFDRKPQYLGLEYEFVGKEGKPARERAYFLPVVGGEEPPTPRIDPKEHDDWKWVSPAEAVALAKFPGNKEAILRATQAPLLLTRGGSFYQEGEEVTHARTAALLHQSLAKEGPHFVVKNGRDQMEVVVEDTPRFVQSFDGAKGEVILKHGVREKLDPTTLRVREDDSLVCQTAEGWDALFLSPAYYELTKDVQSDGQKYVLHFLGGYYDLRIPPKGKGINR